MAPVVSERAVGEPEDPSEYRWEDDASFSVFLLLHHMPENPSAWRTAPAH